MDDVLFWMACVVVVPVVACIIIMLILATISFLLEVFRIIKFNQLLLGGHLYDRKTLRRFTLDDFFRQQSPLVAPHCPRCYAPLSPDHVVCPNSRHCGMLVVDHLNYVFAEDEDTIKASNRQPVKPNFSALEDQQTKELEKLHPWLKERRWRQTH